ncbi:MAG: LysM peptidoglycan-binding domain-containing protein [Burkholderiaceae bacterium]|nr:LysM peptidoglycan-binding domain-containing protein [Burkholderiaceae bacterium]
MALMRVGVTGLAAVLVLSACSSSRGPAPVESRSVAKPGAVPVQRAGALLGSAAPAVSAPSVLVPDGFYRIRKGDTLIGISLDHGIAWRDLAAWNQIENPNLIEVDQLIRIKPPSGSRNAAASTPQSQTAAEKTTPSDQRLAEIRPIGPTGSLASARPAPVPAQPSGTQAAAPQATAPQSANAQPPRQIADAISLSWPSSGQVITQFADPGYKGIAIAGAEGDPILAAGDGRVVYSGSGLRGYGNLVIVKHEGDFLTAYAHNKSILVAEGQTVKRGQKIAELGKSDSEIPKLHFEVRRSGKPVDPLKYLAQR